MTPILDIAVATVRFEALEALADVSLTVDEGAIVGLVGPNGAGKTTLLDAVSGFVPLAAGTVTLGGVDVTRAPAHRRARLGLGRTFQALELFDDLTVDENLLVAGAQPGGPSDLRLPTALAHGDRKDLALGRALAARPRVVLLDEPAAGLDPAGRAALVKRCRALAASGVAVVIADHDLDLVLGLCDSVTVLDFGRVLAAGPPATVRADPAVVTAYLGAPTPAAGPNDAAALPPMPVPPVPMLPPGEPGEVLLDVRGLVAGYGGVPVLHGLDLCVREGEVVALLGPNGAGKTTTLRALSGVVPVAGGSVETLGRPAASTPPHRLARRGLASIPQDRGVLGGLTVAENLRLASPGRDAVARALHFVPALEALLTRRAGRLSGGEQQLLAVARALVRRPKLLFVDELSMGLAPRAARDALDALRALAAERRAGILLAEQHPRLALQLADRAVVLSRGRVVHHGPAADLVRRPEILEAAYLGRASSSG
ncbi:MAG TPA: ATP-binding cassette domain-containing protein [Acidimicrobiales bacterium]